MPLFRRQQGKYSMKSNGKPVISRRRITLVLSAAGLLLLYTITGFFVVPRAAKTLLPEKLSTATGRVVTLGSAAFNPFTFEITLENFAILEKTGEPFASVGRLYANAELLPLVTGKAVLKALVIEQPAVAVARDREGVFNFDDLIPPSGKEPEINPPNPDRKIPAFLVRTIDISAGKASFVDQTAGSGFSLTVDPFAVAVENLGSREKEPARYSFDAATRSGAILAGQGTAAITDLTSTGQITLSGLPLTQFEPYYRKFIKANIKSGRAGAGFTYRYPAGPASPLPAVSNARFSLKDYVVSGPKGAVRLVNIPKLSVTGIQIDPEKQTVLAGKLRLMDTYVRADRSKDGGIYLLEAFMPTFEKPRESAAPETQAVSEPWIVRLEQAEVDNLSLVLNENSSIKPSVYSLEKVAVRASGIEYDTGKMAGIPLIADASVSLHNLKIAAAEADEAIASIPEIEISGVNLDPSAGLVTVKAVTTRLGVFSLLRDKGGAINLIESLPSFAASPEAQDAANQPEKTKAARLAARIDEVLVDGYSLSFRDQALQTPAVLFLDRIALKAGNISTAPNEKATLSSSLRWDKGGTLTSKGTVTLSPLAGDMEVKAEKLEITPVQPYLNEKIQVLITSGNLNTTGRATFKNDPDHGFMASFKGNSLVTDFASLDKYLGKDLLRWKSLHLSGIDVDINPLRVALDEIALTDFYTRTTVNADGTINLRTVLESGETASSSSSSEPPAENPSAKEKQAAFEKTPPVEPEKGADQPLVPITIKAITLQGGTVVFSDQLIEPHFETEMLELGGNISGLSSEELARADVFLAGRLENYSPLKITGKINPLTRNRFSDVSVEFRDIDLSPFSPYTGKYIGYKLEKGKLTLILNYRLSQNTLVAQNKIKFNRLELGEKVESEVAVNLPIKLGLAILSDSEGNVELDLPVRGSVDDPEFSLGAIIFQAIVGLVTKTVSAPFAALGSAFGGGAELSFIDFEAGKTMIGPEQAESLTILATALAERPALNLEITGMVDPVNDTAQLRESRYNDLLLAQQTRALYKGGQAPPEDERPAIDAEKRAAYITRAYREADIPKPRNADGTLKKLPVTEMEKLLFTAITISPADLRHLAMERAEAAKDRLLEDERLKPDRLYITEPVIDVPPDAAEPPRPRVKFAIQG
jgi:hypothetical protein